MREVPARPGPRGVSEFVVLERGEERLPLCGVEHQVSELAVLGVADSGPRLKRATSTQLFRSL